MKAGEIVHGDSGVDYVVEERISDGGYSEIFKVKSLDSASTQKLVLKKIRPKADNCEAAFEVEMQMLSDLNGTRGSPQVEGVLGLRDSCKQQLGLFLDYFDGRDLSGIIRSCGYKGFSPLEIVTLTKRASKILSDALSQYEIVHRDVKPENILVGTSTANSMLSGNKEILEYRDLPGELKVCDFALSLKAGESKLYDLTPEGTVLGTPRYMSPEILSGKDRGSAPSDVWSLGITLYDTILNDGAYPPYLDLPSSVRDYITKNPLPPGLHGPFKEVTPDFCSLIYRMRSVDSTERPTMAEIYKSCVEIEERMLSTAPQIPNFSLQ